MDWRGSAVRTTTWLNVSHQNGPHSGPYQLGMNIPWQMKSARQRWMQITLGTRAAKAHPTEKRDRFIIRQSK